MDSPYFKIIRCGHVLEVFSYDKPPPDNTEAIEWGDDDRFPYHDIYERDRWEDDKEWIKDWERKNKEQSKSEWTFSNANRRRNRIRRLILANFSNNSKFVTLTFKKNVTDLDEANKEFKRFIQRMRRKYGKFKYVAVIEFQKRGAVHYHMLSDLPYIENSKLSSIWRNGFVRINNIKHVDNVGAYVVKYMTKEAENPILQGRKTYLCSQGLEREEIIRGDTAEAIIESLGLKEKAHVFSNEYATEYMGKCEYKEYNLNRLELID